MAQIDLGKLKFTWKGTWSTTSAYEVDDVVFYNGSSYICIVDAANTTDSPEQNTTNWAVMQRGINYVGDWSSSTSYYRGDVVLYNSTAYIMDSDSVSPLSGTNYTPGTTASANHWKVISTGTAGTYTTAGDIEYRDNDGTNSRLPIGALQSNLVVENNPKESFPAGTTVIYEQVQLPGATPATNGKSAYLFKDDHPTAANASYTVTVAASKFVIGGVSQQALALKTGSTYTFDVSDATNASHVLAFNARTGASNTTFDFETGAIADGVVRSGTPGQAGATVTWTVPHLGFLVYEYYCTQHSGMGAAITWTSSTKIAGRLLHSDAHPTIDLTRGSQYTFTFPSATGMTYSVKDPNASNYSTAGTNGRVTAGVTPDSVSGGGTIAIVADSNTPAALRIRDEGMSADEINVTLNNMFFKPVWSGGNKSLNHEHRQPSDTHYNNITYNTFANHDINNYTESLLPQLDYLKKSGRGFRYGTCKLGYRQNGVISDRHYTFWGNMYHNSSQGYYYGGAIGTGCTSYNGTNDRPWNSNWRCPKFWTEALAGSSDYAHFLTDTDGNDLGFLDVNGDVVIDKPRLKQVHRGNKTAYYLYENGIVTFAGYGGYGGEGFGKTNTQYSEVAVTFHDENTTLLSGTNYPKIKQFDFSNAHMGDNGHESYFSMYALDTDGNMYSMGYNGYGQLGINSTSSNYYFRKIPSSNFNNEKVIYICTSGYYYTTTYCITETGKMFAWGRNNRGQCLLGNTTQFNTPQEVTGVAGSELLNKKVIHIEAMNDGNDIGKVFVLTDEGKMYFGGYLQDYGIYAGYYDSTNTTNQTLPKLLTNSSTLWNSDNQKVVYFVTNNTRYSTIYMITDGGTTGLPQKVYATGGNSRGQQGTGTHYSNPTGSSSMGTGNWFGAEIMFRDRGQDWNNQSNNNMVNEVYGNWQSFQTGGTNAGKLKIGKIVKIFPSSHSGENYNRCVLLDEFGKLYWTGHWDYDMEPNLERNNSRDFNYGLITAAKGYSSGGTSGANPENDTGRNAYFMQVNSLPGKCIDFSHTGGTYSENGWDIITDSGTLYVGGYDGWSQAGFSQGSQHGFWRYQWILGGQA